MGHDSLNVAAEQAGRLTQVPDQNVSGTVQGFIRGKNVAQNGWPDPLAAADHFRYAIEHDHPTERRQLEMLLAGVVLGKLTLQDVPPQEDPPLLSLEHLVNEYRKTGLPELARVAVVHPHRDGDVVLGFNSPLTLLCPAPIANDERRERAWSVLWQALTGSEQPRDWRTEEIGEWRPAGLAVRQIRTWIENLKSAHGGAAPSWTSVFADDSSRAPATGGRGRTLSVYWGTGAGASLVAIALPTASSGDYWPDEDTPRILETELLQTQAPALRSVTTDAGTFQMVEFTLPDHREPTRAFWREHLDHLQGRGDIAAFGARPDDRRLAVLTADQQTAAILENAILLDRDDLMVRDCTPLRQDPAPGSSTRPGEVRYPHYPLRSDFLGLVETDAGERVVDLLKRGERVRVMPPSIDAGPRPPGTGSGRSVSTSSSLLKEAPGAGSQGGQEPGLGRPARGEWNHPGGARLPGMESIPTRPVAARQASSGPAASLRAEARRPAARRAGQRVRQRGSCVSPAVPTCFRSRCRCRRSTRRTTRTRITGRTGWCGRGSVRRSPRTGAPTTSTSTARTPGCA